MTFSNIRALVGYLSMAIMIRGTIGVMMLSFPSKSFKKVGKHLKTIFRSCKHEPRQSINRIMGLAVETRMKGLLPLEDKLVEIDEPFLYNGLVPVADSVDSGKVKQVMETKLEQLDKRHVPDCAFYKKTAAYSPAFGMTGTLVGLILTLGNTSNVDVPAEGVATVLITTLYGSLTANVIYLPTASKLKVRYDRGFLYKQLVMKGALIIQESESPKFIGEKLSEPLSATSVE